MSTSVSAHHIQTVRITHHNVNGTKWVDITARNNKGEELEITLFHNGNIDITGYSEDANPPLDIRYVDGPRSDDLQIYINSADYEDDGFNPPEFLGYTTFKGGNSYVSFNDDAGAETTFFVSDIDEIIAALQEIKTHDGLCGGGR